MSVSGDWEWRYTLRKIFKEKDHEKLRLALEVDQQIDALQQILDDDFDDFDHYSYECDHYDEIRLCY